MPRTKAKGPRYTRGKFSDKTGATLTADCKTLREALGVAVELLTNWGYPKTAEALKAWEDAADDNH